MCLSTTPVGLAHFRGRDASGSHMKIGNFGIFAAARSVIVMNKSVINKAFGREAFGLTEVIYASRQFVSSRNTRYPNSHPKLVVQYQ
jgi:hypothetical protein